MVIDKAIEKIKKYVFNEKNACLTKNNKCYDFTILESPFAPNAIILSYFLQPINDEIKMGTPENVLVVFDTDGNVNEEKTKRITNISDRMFIDSLQILTVI